MATITFTGSNFCTGNGHFTLTISGAKSATFSITVASILGVDPPSEEVAACVTTLLKLWSAGKTAGQAKTALLAGFNVVIG